MDWTRTYVTPKVGDRITTKVPVRRRWWQFWRPRIVGYEQRKFVIIDTKP